MSRRLSLDSAARVLLGTFAVISWGGVGCADQPVDSWDTIVVSVAPDLAGEARTGRLELLFITDTDRRWSMRQPLRGPWPENPQPIASMAIEQWTGRTPVNVTDEQVAMFGGPLDALHGPVRVQALLHINDDRPRLLPGPGCLYSKPVAYEADAAAAQRVEIVLSQQVQAIADSQQPANLHWISLPSAILSGDADRPVSQRCAVALPAAYDHDSTVRWPVVFVIPDRTEDPQRVAHEFAQLLLTPGVEDIAPNAVHVVLDPQTPSGHHGFIDSAFHGRRAAALVQELIVHLDQTYRLNESPTARVVTGIGLGAWSALWLTLHHPDVFGGCWATAPSPIDFRAFLNVNLYDDTNVFSDVGGQPVWAYRRTGMRIDEMVPSMTTRQMWQMEQAIDPTGRSGGLWQTFLRLYSPVDPTTRSVQPLFDPETGAIDEAVREHWAQYDLARLVRSDPQRYLQAFGTSVHVFCGELDSWFFDRAVRQFSEMLPGLGPDGERAQQSILMIEGATHDNVQRHVFDDWNRQLREHFERHDVAVR